MGSHRVQWCNLPNDMLIMVAKRLDSRTEILRFRAVCSSWRSSLPPSPNKSALFPAKFPFPITEPTIYYLEPCSTDNPDHASSSSSSSSSPKGWMVRVGEDSSGKMRILDAFSEKFSFRSEVINLLHIRVSEVAKVCSFRHPNFVNKVAMSSSSTIPAWIDDDDDDSSNGSSDCARLTIGIEKKLWYFKLGDNNLTMVDDGQGENSDYQDILYHEGKFYAVDAGGKMIVIDSLLNVKVIESPIPRDAFHYGAEHKFLVESNKNVYLVGIYHDEEDVDYRCFLDNYIETKVLSYSLIHMDVYKLNKEEKGWVQVTNLGDEAFFVGDDCCFSVSRLHKSLVGRVIAFILEINYSIQDVMITRATVYACLTWRIRGLGHYRLSRAILRFSGHRQLGSNLKLLLNHLLLDVKCERWKLQ